MSRKLTSVWSFNKESRIIFSMGFIICSSIGGNQVQETRLHFFSRFPKFPKFPGLQRNYLSYYETWLQIIPGRGNMPATSKGSVGTLFHIKSAAHGPYRWAYNIVAFSNMTLMALVTQFIVWLLVVQSCWTLQHHGL